MMMRRVAGVACAALALVLAGCAADDTQRVSLTGDRSASAADIGGVPGAEGRPAVIPVDHVFELTNTGSGAVVIVSHRTRIDTTWHFADSGDALLPRTVQPGESVLVSVTGKVRRPGPQRFFVDLILATGDVVDLELLVGD